jgi:hypothetical protein
MSTATAINTAKVTDRRQLHFATLDDILADVNQLADAKDIRALGNWSPGQIFQHLATIMNKSIDGFDHHLPRSMRVLVRLFFKRRFLRNPMPPGFKLNKKTAAEIIPPSPIETHVGLRSIRDAILQTETKRAPRAFMGPMSQGDWLKLHCRHSELHLSFLTPIQ